MKVRIKCKMENQAVFGEEGTCVNAVREEDEDEFRSCCEDEEVWKDTEEPVKEESKSDDILDEFTVKMFFKGLSIDCFGDSSSGVSGIGVSMERSLDFPVIKVQKRLDFYVEEPVAEYLALMDGLMEASQNNIRRVYAFTDSELLYDQVSKLFSEEILLVYLLISYAIYKISSFVGSLVLYRFSLFIKFYIFI